MPPKLTSRHIKPLGHDVSLSPEHSIRQLPMPPPVMPPGVPPVPAAPAPAAPPPIMVGAVGT
jgi:hypothetical protein